MNTRLAAMIAAFALLPGATAIAEIYKSEGADGTTVFSDIPPQGVESDEVEVQDANIANSVEPRPWEPEEEKPAARAPAPEAQQAAGQSEEEDVIYNNYDDNEALKRRALLEKRPGNDDPEVAPHPGVEPRPGIKRTPAARPNVGGR